MRRLTIKILLSLLLLVFLTFVLLSSFVRIARADNTQKNTKTVARVENSKKSSKAVASAKMNTYKNAKQNKNGSGNQKPKNLKKEMHFGDQLVNGKFQLPGDSAVEVENEKPVFNLLQIRSDFNDRRLKETTRDQ
jgi:hypothetical protein